MGKDAVRITDNSKFMHEPNRQLCSMHESSVCNFEENKREK